MQVTTVGYGDTTPSSIVNSERLFCLFVAALGTGLFAYITGEITALAKSKHASLASFLSKKESLDDFMAYYNLPANLRVKIRKFYDDGYAQGSFLKTDEILAELPNNLRLDVREHLRSASVKSVDIFHTAPTEVCAFLIHQFIPMEYEAEEAIVVRGTECDEIVILNHGSAVLSIFEKTPASRSKWAIALNKDPFGMNSVADVARGALKSVLVGAGTSFGLYHEGTAFDTGPGGWEYRATATAATHCEVFKVDHYTVSHN